MVSQCHHVKQCKTVSMNATMIRESKFLTHLSPRKKKLRKTHDTKGRRKHMRKRCMNRTKVKNVFATAQMVRNHQPVWLSWKQQPLLSNCSHRFWNVTKCDVRREAVEARAQRRWFWNCLRIRSLESHWTTIFTLQQHPTCLPKHVCSVFVPVSHIFGELVNLSRFSTIQTSLNRIPASRRDVRQGRACPRSCSPTMRTQTASQWVRTRTATVKTHGLSIVESCRLTTCWY